jgi:hypothetical protein
MLLRDARVIVDGAERYVEVVGVIRSQAGLASGGKGRGEGKGRTDQNRSLHSFSVVSGDCLHSRRVQNPGKDLLDVAAAVGTAGFGRRRGFLDGPGASGDGRLLVRVQASL